jgi:hypothetical protein
VHGQLATHSVTTLLLYTSLDSVGGIDLSVLAGCLGFESLVNKRFFSTPRRYDLLIVPGSYPGVKWLRLGNNALPSSA